MNKNVAFGAGDTLLREVTDHGTADHQSTVLRKKNIKETSGRRVCR